ncbi:MAG: GGDEF domain-containing response regulator [Nitrospiraceae bacterium]|nr:MAG: GGDEF domain-containing response regulator [Nitrospiraceae bacterium]
MNSERIKVLLVDDDEDDYFLTRDLFAEINPSYDLQWVSSYAEALKVIGRTEHDICLFDYRLGEYTGLDLLREAVSAGCKAPIILLTGQGDSGIDIEAIKGGAADYLSKTGITSHLLERSVRYAIERKRTEERIVHMAYYDGLTNLPNRSLFLDRLSQALTHSNRYKDNCALLFIDLDNFKKINDTLDHRIGDLLLKGVADRLNCFVRSADTIARQKARALASTVARLGGDEFTVLLTEIYSMQDAAKVAQRILNSLNSPFNLDGHEVFISASIGIAIHPADGEDMDTLIKNADTAMYHAKENGKNHFQFYKYSMNETALERLTMENDLRRAITGNELSLLYQPRINISNGTIVGTEALVRWEHPVHGTISPTRFIPLAEDTGLIVPIGEWVLKTACRQKKIWHGKSPVHAPVSVSLNISGHQFSQGNLASIMEKILEDTGLDPSFLELEITESAIMKNADATIALLHKLRDMGVKLSMDDFGTGYSSFNYLKRFPLDIIKIDRSFIKDITNSRRDATIVKAIIAMAHTLELKVVAEGVETEEQLRLLQDMECDEMQGYLLCRPLPAVHVHEFLEIWDNMIRKNEKR